MAFTPISQINKSGFTPINKLTPDQSATTLGSTNNWLSNMISAGKSFSTGVAKQELGTLQNIGNVVLDPAKKALGLEDVKTGISPETLKPEGTAEKVGSTAASIGEFFIPGGAEKTAFTKAAEHIDKLPKLIGVTGKSAEILTGALKTALKSGISGISFGGITGAQTGDIEKAKSAAKFGAVIGGLTGAFEKLAPGISQALNKADFRLTPVREAKAGKIADSAAKFITDNKIMGSDTTKFSKLSVLNNNMESALQGSLPKDIAVPKDEIINNIEQNVESLRSTEPAIYNQARSKADEAINLIKTQKGDIAFTKGGTISIKDALNGKRSWGSMAFKTSKKAKIDPTVSSEGAYAVEQAYQKALEDTLSRTNTTIKISPILKKYFGGQSEVELSQFNKVYSDAINAKNLTGIAQYRNDAGLFGRLFGLWVGKSIGQAIVPGLGGEIVGAGIGEAASAHLPGMARNILERGLTHETTPETVAKIYQGVQNQSDEDQNLPQ